MLSLNLLLLKRKVGSWDMKQYMQPYIAYCIKLGESYDALTSDLTSFYCWDTNSNNKPSFSVSRLWYFAVMKHYFIWHRKRCLCNLPWDQRLCTYSYIVLVSPIDGTLTSLSFYDLTVLLPTERILFIGLWECAILLK